MIVGPFLFLQPVFHVLGGEDPAPGGQVVMVQVCDTRVGLDLVKARWSCQHQVRLHSIPVLIFSLKGCRQVGEAGSNRRVPLEQPGCWLHVARSLVRLDWHVFMTCFARPWNYKGLDTGEMISNLACIKHVVEPILMVQSWSTMSR